MLSNIKYGVYSIGFDLGNTSIVIVIYWDWNIVVAVGMTTISVTFVSLHLDLIWPLYFAADIYTFAL